jgi:hypothetical protein
MGDLSQVDLVRFDRAVPVAGCVGSRNPRASASSQRLAAQIPEASSPQQHRPPGACLLSLGSRGNGSAKNRTAGDAACAGTALGYEPIGVGIPTMRWSAKDRGGHPNAEWIARQLTEACGWRLAPRYIIRDRDCVYGHAFVRRLRAMGIRDRPIAPRSPWQNGCAERLVGSIRRDCLDHVAVFASGTYVICSSRTKNTTTRPARTCHWRRTRRSPARSRSSVRRWPSPS